MTPGRRDLRIQALTKPAVFIRRLQLSRMSARHLGRLQEQFLTIIETPLI